MKLFRSVVAAGASVVLFAGAAVAQTATHTATLTPTSTPVRTPFPVTELTLAEASQLTLTAVGSNWNYINDGSTVVVIKNGHATDPTTVTVYSVGEARFGRTGNLSFTITAGGIGFIPPLPPDGFNQKSGTDAGRVYVNFSATTTVTAGIVRILK